jgi:hypothetical protein
MQIYNMYRLLDRFGNGKMSPRKTIRGEPEIRKRSSKHARTERKTPRGVLKKPMENYTEKRGNRTYIDDLWNRIGGKLRSKGVRQRDVDKAIIEVRKSRA